MLLALKFKGSVETGNCLGLLLAQHPSISTLTVDCIVPIPLHKERLALRGFNQSLEIARPLAARLAVPLLPRLMVRKKATAPQSGCNLNTRRENIRNAFQSSSEVAGKRILLVDDTVTTGSTIEAAARSLREAGAKTISVAVISRTARHFLKR